MCLDFRFTLVPVFLLLDFGVVDNGNIIPVDGDHVRPHRQVGQLTLGAVHRWGNMLEDTKL